MRKLATLILLSGCTVGPDYHLPDISLPSGWFSSSAPTPSKDVVIEENWWKNFHDTTLNALIEKAIQGNFDLKIAEARIAQARAARAAASAGLWPSVTLGGNAERQGNRIAFPGNFPGLSKPFNTFQTGFDASWELDLFGGTRRQIEADTATLSAAEASRDDVRVSLLAEVAHTYVDIRQYQAQLTLANETLASDEQTVRIARERYTTGNAPQLDLTEALAQLESNKAQLPYYQSLLTQSEFSLDVLLGAEPGATHAMVATQPTSIPVSDKNLVLAAPASVIAQRPDIRMAERQLASMTALQGVATAQLFPNVSLAGFLGLLNINAGNLLTAGSKSWDVIGNATWPILNFGRISANINLANARQQEALATYQKAVIAALADVEKSATAYVKQEEYREALGKAAQDKRKAASIARQRYRQGITSFLEVLDADRTLYTAEIQLAQAKAQASQNLISVYKSLGGGWKTGE